MWEEEELLLMLLLMLLLLLLLLLLQGRLCGWVLLQLRAPASCAPSAAKGLATGSFGILTALRLTPRATWLCRMVATIACRCFGTATGRTCARLAALEQGTGSSISLLALRLMPLGTSLCPKPAVIACKC